MSRPRRYSFKAPSNFANPVAAHLVAGLDEVCERYFDMLQLLSLEHWDAVPAPFWGSIAQITAHCGKAEVLWLKKATRTSTADPMLKRLTMAEAPGPCPLTPGELVRACRTVRGHTKLLLARCEDIDKEQRHADYVVSIRGALMHLIWHWTFHHGQVCTLYRLCGLDYDWSFDGHVTGG